ncbi:MAG: amidase [Halobacteriota archaeon]
MKTKYMLHEAPLAETVDALRTGRLELNEYIDELEDRAGSVEPEIRSLVPEPDRWDRVRAATADLEDRYPNPADRPPLYGVPIGVKDIFHADGFQTRAGSDLPPETLAGEEAESVRTLRRAGGVVLGKTVTTEFAHFEPGPTRNPNNTDHTPGGSSSGSAAAVAAGLCPVAFGSQTIGSIVRPAAFCGVVGFKPSYGRISTAGVIPLSTSVDHVGFFTQDTAGAALVAALLCEEWRPVPEPKERPTLGVPVGPYLQQASETALEAFETHVGRLESVGYDVERIATFESIDAINERHEQLVAADAALAHEQWYRTHKSSYSENFSELITDGFSVSVAQIARSRRSRHDLRSALTESLDEHDVDMWIAPAAPGPAPEGIDTTGDPVMNLPWTHAGLPTIAVPADKTETGLPLGIQCAGRFGADEDVLRWSHGIADALEKV